MFQHATAFSASPAPAKAESGYPAWRASMEKTVSRMQGEPRTAGPIPSFGRMVNANTVVAQSYAPSHADPAQATGLAYETAPNNDEYTFEDLVDMINPLHHVPVIGNIYRKLTGDTIKPMSNIIGGGVFGGPIGAIGSTINTLVKSTTGKDIAENALAIAGFETTGDTAKPKIAYDIQDDKLANANSNHSNADAIKAYTTADGHRNFSARSNSQTSWNI